MDIRDRSAARAELVKAKNLQPRNPVTWLNLGHVRLTSTGASPSAQPEFQRALELDHDARHDAGHRHRRRAQSAGDPGGHAAAARERIDGLPPS